MLNRIWKLRNSPPAPEALASRRPALRPPRIGAASQAVPLPQPTILVIHDRHDDAPALVDGLRGAGYDVATRLLTSAVQSLDLDRRPHVILWRVTKLVDGKAAGDRGAIDPGAPSSPAVVFLMDQATEEERVAILDGGADDVLVVPMSLRELAARLRAVIRRKRPSIYRSSLTFNDIVLDPAAARVTRGGVPLSLTRKQLRLLQVFMEYPDRVFSREELIHEVWGQRLHVGPRAVDVHIRRLRRAAGKQGFEIIRTVRGVGYALGLRACE